MRHRVGFRNPFAGLQQLRLHLRGLHGLHNGGGGRRDRISWNISRGQRSIVIVVHAQTAASAGQPCGSTASEIQTAFWSNRRHLLQFGARAARVHHHHILGGIVRDEAIAVPRMNVAHILGTTPRIAHGQDALEGVAKLLVEDRIDDRIEGRVRVAQPGEDLEGLSADAGLAEGGRDVDAEEGHPANEKDAHDYAHRDGRLVVGYVIRRTVGVQIAHLELLGLVLRAPDALVPLLLGYLTWSSYRLDGLHVLLGIAV